LASSFSTDPPGDRGALECSWNVIAKLPNGRVQFQARGVPSVTQEQGRPSSLQSGGVEDQPQYPGLWHSHSPSARSFSRSPSPAPPSFTQYPSPPRSLVRDGQTRPLRPRLVISRPPLSPSPQANSFVIGTAVINTHPASDRTPGLRRASAPKGRPTSTRTPSPVVPDPESFAARYRGSIAQVGSGLNCFQALGSSPGLLHTESHIVNRGPQ